MGTEITPAQLRSLEIGKARILAGNGREDGEVNINIGKTPIAAIEGPRFGGPVAAYIATSEPEETTAQEADSLIEEETQTEEIIAQKNKPNLFEVSFGEKETV